MDNFKQVVEVQDVLDGSLLFEAREGRGVGIFSEACNIFLTFCFHDLFSVGNSLCKNFVFTSRIKKYIY